VNIGFQDSDVEKMSLFLDDLWQLARSAGRQPQSPGPDGADWPVMPVVGVRTVAGRLPWILVPQSAADGPGPPAAPAQAGTARLVPANDLDVLLASDSGESETASNWRVMAMGAEWRGGVDLQVLSSLDSGLCLAGLTYAVLHGKAVFLVLGHRNGDVAAHDTARAATPGPPAGLCSYIDFWQSREELGTVGRSPLLRVQLRSPDRPGTTLALLDSLREAFQQSVPELHGRAWNVWYAKVIAAANVVRVWLTVRLTADTPTPAEQAELLELSDDRFSQIQQLARDLATQKIAALRSPDGPAGEGLDALDNTAISIELVTAPDLDPLG
jgi:hypothetical protein